RKKGYKGTPGKFSWGNLGKATLQAIPSLSLIIVVIGGIIAGVFSATEGSAIAVVYALILGICYRNITWKSFWNIVVDSAKMSGMVVFLDRKSTRLNSSRVSISYAVFCLKKQ